MTGFLIMPVHLVGIDTPDESISLSYFTDFGYASRFWSMALGWNKDEYYPNDIYNPVHDFDMKQFSVFMKTSLDYTTSPLLQESIRKNLKHSVLHRIGIQSKNSASQARSVYFDYSFNNRRKVSQIASRSGIPALIPDYATASGMLILRGYQVPVSDMPGQDWEYNFAYNTEKPLPGSYTDAATDYWGYYAGRNISFAAIPTFKKPDPSLIYAQSDVLTEITYPTGGKSRFEYELHHYSKVVDVTHTKLNSQSGKAGGLRVSAISRHDRDGNLLDKKKYYYSENKASESLSNPSSGILKEAPVYEISYSALVDRKISVLRQQSEGGYSAPVTNLNSPVVGYSCVIEEALDAAGCSEGYIKRRYSNYDADIYGNTHPDEPAVYCNASGESSVKPFTSRSGDRGKLLSEEYYNSAGRLLKKTVQHYKEVNPGAFRTAHQSAVFYLVDLITIRWGAIGTLTRVYTHSYLPDSIAEIRYPSDGSATGYESRRTLAYDSHRLLKKETFLTSRGEHHTVSYTHPSDYSNYKWMVDAHLLSPVVEKTTAEGGKSLKETYSYRYEGAKYIPYIQSVSRSFNGTSTRTDYLVLVTDEYSNPVSVTDKGVNTVYIWSYEGKRLIARIENAAYDKVRTLLGKSPSGFSSIVKPDNTTYQLIEGIRHKLPKAQVSIYKYTPGLQVESVTSPDGQTVFYKYDYLDRLREEYLQEKTSGLYRPRLLHSYDYHYQHPEVSGHPVH